jgi:1-acyl-sn-glycerol-3-phosphate acyltransferase
VSTERADLPDIAPSWRIGVAVKAIDQLARITRPQFDGLDRLPADGRFLLAGNHTIYGVLDVPFMVAGIHKEHGFAIRSLGDHTHWKIPLWRELLEQLGAVRGTRANAAELMEQGATLLVFPGGSREVNKRRGEAYQLFWRERIGFAELAIAHDYPIVPFAAVGAEEMLSVVADVDTPVFGHASRLIDRTLGFALPSIVRGIGPTPIPRPKKLHFWFGEAIETGGYAKQGTAGAKQLRDLVRGEIEHGIAGLRARQ